MFNSTPERASCVGSPVEGYTKMELVRMENPAFSSYPYKHHGRQPVSVGVVTRVSISVTRVGGLVRNIQPRFTEVGMAEMGQYWC